jgi:type IV secretory pathway ATPase VirB11/archaellum biosynthesis ATPase
MEKKETHKKNPLHPSQSETIAEIEQKIDQLFKKQSEKQKQQKTVENEPEDWVSPQINENPGLFYIDSKKKKESAKTQNKEKKPTPKKTKKHIGFKKKKQETSTPKTKPVSITKTSDAPEELPHFAEAIGQVKTEEAAWLDQQIKANMHLEKETTSENTPSDDNIDEQKSSETPSDEPSQPSNEINKQEAIPAESSTPEHESEPAVILEQTSSESGLVTETVDDPSSQDTNQKELKLDEIAPDGQIRFLKEANQLKANTLQRMGYAENAIDEIDFYPIHEPFAYVEIIREKDSLDKRYVLLEMQLSKDEEYLLKFIQETLDGFDFKTTDLEIKGENKYLSEKVEMIIEDYMLNIDSLTKKKIVYYLEKESIGLGKLDVIMKDPNIEDISCDGSGVFIFLYHRRYGSLKSNVQFNDEDELTAFVVKLAQKCGKHISISEPMLDATMPDGSRIQMTLSTEVTTKGSTFTIRKFSEDPFSPPDLIEFHTMSSEMVAYMWLAVENGINALIAGGTAAGKTSTLNALCLFIPRESKIVSIEETREINLPHPNWIPGVVRSGFGEVVGNKVIGEIDLYDLMKAALRQRPEYILVGEIRGKEAYVLFQAMATGHTTYSTVHADSAQSLIHRLEGKPIEIPRIMLQTLDVVIIQVISRVKNKRARRCKQIIEIIDIDPTTKEILTNEVFRWDPIEDKFVYSGKSYILERVRAEKDISREGMISEIKNRTMLLDWMNKNNIREFKKVATIIAQYVDNPSEVIKKIRNE